MSEWFPNTSLLICTMTIVPAGGTAPPPPTLEKHTTHSVCPMLPWTLQTWHHQWCEPSWWPLPNRALKLLPIRGRRQRGDLTRWFCIDVLLLTVRYPESFQRVRAPPAVHPNDANLPLDVQIKQVSPTSSFVSLFLFWFYIAEPASDRPRVAFRHSAHLPSAPRR